MTTKVLVDNPDPAPEETHDTIPFSSGTQPATIPFTIDNWAFLATNANHHQHWDNETVFKRVDVLISSIEK